MVGQHRTEVRNTVEDAVALVVHAYVKEQASIREIADRYPGATYATVRATLANAGVRFRQGGSRPGARRSRIAPVPAAGDTVGLRQIRELAGLSQGEMSRVTGVEQSFISRLERQSLRQIKLETIIRLVEGCGGRLRVTAEFDTDEFVLHDTYDDADDTDDAAET